MVGTVIVVVLLFVVACLVAAALRDVLVFNFLTPVGRGLGSLLEWALAGIIHVIRLIGIWIDGSYQALRNVQSHSQEGGEYSRFWDLLVPIVFLGLLGVLVVSDYAFFSARIGPLLFNRASGIDETTLIPVLGALFVVTLIVVGYALSDAYGHSPAGQPLMFGMLSDEHRRWVRKVLWGAVALMGVAALMLGIWTVEKTVLGIDDHFTAGAFQITFAVLAIMATALCVVPALLGILAVLTVVLYVARALLWLVGMVFSLALILVDRVVITLLVAVLDVMAKIGSILLRRKDLGELKPREEISPFVSNNPLLPDLTPPSAPQPALPAQASTPVAEPVTTGAHPAQSGAQPLAVAVAEPAPEPATGVAGNGSIPEPQPAPDTVLTHANGSGSNGMVVENLASGDWAPPRRSRPDTFEDPTS